MSHLSPPQTTDQVNASPGIGCAPSNGYISESHQDKSERSEANFIVLDAGHRYELFVLDGAHQQELRFVKRFDLGRPWRFPGNLNGYAGTTLQGVMRVLLDRIAYLQNQIWSVENFTIIKLLRLSLWCLEFRAARRHGRSYWHGITFAASAQMCPKCGHTVCDHTGAVAPATQGYNDGTQPPRE